MADGFRGAENIGDGESSSAILLILWPCLESRSGPRCSCCCSPSHSFLSFLVFLFLLLFLLLLLLLVAFVVSVVLRDVAVVVVGVVVGFARPICDVQKQRRKQQTSTEVAEVGNHKEELHSSSDPHQLAFYLTHTLTFYLEFYLTCTLTFYLTFFLAFYLACVRVQAHSTASAHHMARIHVRPAEMATEPEEEEEGEEIK